MSQLLTVIGLDPAIQRSHPDISTLGVVVCNRCERQRRASKPRILQVRAKLCIDLVPIETRVDALVLSG